LSDCCSLITGVGGGHRLDCYGESAPDQDVSYFDCSALAPL
jgi:hypothetical protein